MKHTFLILFAAALLVAGCNKSNNNNNPNKNNSGNVTPGKEEKTEDGTNTVTDIDGNTYKTVKIGKQVWMAENLKVTKDRDGKEIALSRKGSYDTPYRYYPRHPMNVEKYGYQYNWEATKRVCPKGWHLPTDSEWTQLTDYVSSQSQYVCGDDKDNIAKALASKDGWKSCDESCMVGNAPSGNNATGFGALPAGASQEIYGSFGCNAIFWSATEYNSSSACVRYLDYDNAGVDRGHAEYNTGLSVRCVRD